VAAREIRPLKDFRSPAAGCFRTTLAFGVESGAHFVRDQFAVGVRNATRLIDIDAQHLGMPRPFQFHFDDFEIRGSCHSVGNLLDARNGVVPSHVP